MTHRLIALLPLDDRPPTLLFPQRIAAIAGLEVLTPPRVLLGRFLEPGDRAALAGWLEAVARTADALVIAVDMLAYGGLIASRDPRWTLEEALRAVALLPRLRQAHPTLPILAASVIMRISITSSGAHLRQHYLDLIRYSELHYLVTAQGRSDLQPELERLRAALPPAILEGYQAARRRNHALNLQMLTYRATGVLDALLLLQEDASAAGPHLLEQQALRARAEELGIGPAVPIYPGADEGTQTLLARLINAARAPRFALRWSSPTGAAQIAPFEDRPLRETVQAHISAAGGQCVATDDAADVVLWVHSPCSATETQAAAQNIAQLIDAGQAVALADVHHPNGADPVLVQALADRGVLPRLIAYAGWNTAGNTLGTTIAHASAWCCAQQQGLPARLRAAHERFLFERYVDDWGYQSVVRPALEAELRARGSDALNLGQEAGAVEALVRERLGAWAQALWRSGGWAGAPPALDIRLPWPRTFEVEVTAYD
ncbi:DUF4127 family protein [Kallotenue papyrolyticum]|uniref:DUF4127 family protein n=1 Tax=Kallotenue papyrolyticum TaxID=1325125 RepID=UPI0004927279|nr:DUF4127 family protein [Kallotenue papyrolyticum]